MTSALRHTVHQTAHCISRQINLRCYTLSDSTRNTFTASTCTAMISLISFSEFCLKNSEVWFFESLHYYDYLDDLCVTIISEEKDVEGWYYLFADKLGLSEYAIVTVVLNLYLLTKISKLAHWAILVPKFKLYQNAWSDNRCCATGTLSHMSTLSSCWDQPLYCNHLAAVNNYTWPGRSLVSIYGEADMTVFTVNIVQYLFHFSTEQQHLLQKWWKFDNGDLILSDTNWGLNSAFCHSREFSFTNSVCIVTQCVFYWFC